MGNLIDISLAVYYFVSSISIVQKILNARKK